MQIFFLIFFILLNFQKNSNNLEELIFKNKQEIS